MSVKNSFRPELKRIEKLENRVLLDGLAVRFGVSYPSWWVTDYEQPASDESLALITSETNLDTVVIVPTWYMDDYMSNAIAPDSVKTASDAGVRHAIQEAQGLGLDVVLKPHVDPWGAWRGLIDPADDAAWFASYETFITHYATIAQEEGVGLFVVGTELKSMSGDEHTAAWGDVIDAVESVYTGELSYAANHDEYFNVSFWDRLDYVGIDAYYDLSTAAPGTVPDTAALVAGWQPYIGAIAAWRSAEGITQPVLLTEIGYRSIETAQYQPWDWERDGEPSEEAQAACYKGAIAAWANVPWFEGMFFWNWGVNSSSVPEKGYEPHGKLAEDVLLLPPDGSITAPAPETWITAGGSIDLASIWRDPNGTATAWAWQIAGPGGFAWTSALQNPGALQLDADGTYEISLTVTDDDGAADPTPATMIVKATPADNLPPEGTIESPADGLIMEAETSVALQGSGDDLDGAVAAWAWTITGPGGFAWNSSVEDPGLLQLNEPGVYSISFLVTDNGGLADPFPATATVTVMEATETNQLPDGAIESPLNGLILNVGDSIDLQGSGTDPDGSIGSYFWMVGGPGAFLKTYSDEDPGLVRLDTAGYYVVTLLVRDDRGDADPEPPAVMIQVGSPVNAPPEGVIDSPTDGIVIRAGESVNLQATATDSDGTVILHTWVGAGPSNYQYNQPLEDPGEVVLTMPGQYYFQYVAVDNALQPDPTPPAVSVTVVAGAGNMAPQGQIVSPALGTVIPTGQIISLQGGGVDPDGAIVSWAWEVTGPGGIFWTYNTQNPEPIRLTVKGQYTVKLTATDNEGEADPTPETVIVTVVSSGVYLKEDAPDYWQLDDPDGIFRNDGANYCGPTAASNAVVWLQTHGYATFPPPSEQYATIQQLADYMQTDILIEGTSVYELSNGLSTWIEDYYSPGDYEMYLRGKHFGGTSPNSGDLDWAVGKLAEPDSVVMVLGGAYMGTSRVSGHFVMMSNWDAETSMVGVKDPRTRYPERSDYYRLQWDATDACYVIPDYYPTIPGIEVRVEDIYVLEMKIAPDLASPNAIIDAPVDGRELVVGESIALAGSGTDADGEVVAWAWEILGPDGFYRTSTAEDPGLIALPLPGEYTINLSVTDDDGLTDMSPATRTVRVTSLNGTIYEQNITEDGSGHQVVVVWGSPFERGFAQGYLLSDQIEDSGQELIDFCAAEGVPYSFLRAYTYMVDWGPDTTIMEEFEGMAAGLKAANPDTIFDIRDVMLGNMLGDIGELDLGYSKSAEATACHSTSTWGSFVEDPIKMISTRRLDNAGDRMGTSLLRHTLVANFPDEGPSFINVGWPGTIVVGTGLNQYGTQVSINSYFHGSDTPINGSMLRATAARYLLVEWATGDPGDLDNGYAMLQDYDCFTPAFINYYAADGNGGVITSSRDQGFYNLRKPQSAYFSGDVIITTNDQTDGLTYPAAGKYIEDWYKLGGPKTLEGQWNMMTYSRGLQRFSVEYRGVEDMTLWFDGWADVDGTTRTPRLELEYGDLRALVPDPDNDAPNGAIAAPLQDATVDVGATLNLRAGGSDPDGTIASWLWEITGPGGFTWTSNLQNPDVILNVPGQYTAILTVTDNDGAADPVPAMTDFTVRQVGNTLLGVVDTGRGKVYVYDIDGLDNGIPIDGNYNGASYNPYDLSNDLMIVGTPSGVIVVARGWVMDGRTYKAADFSALGIVVDGNLATFVDQRIGTGDISLIAAKGAMNTVVVKGGVTGLPDSGLGLSVPGVMDVPAGMGIYAPNGTLGTAIFQRAGMSLTGDLLCKELGTVITSGSVNATITSGGKLGALYVGIPAGGNLDGQVNAVRTYTLFANGNIGAEINSTYCINQIHAAGAITGDITTDYCLFNIYSGGNITSDIYGGGTVKLLYAKGDITGNITGGEVQLFYAGGSFTGTLRSMASAGTILAGGDFVGALTVDVGTAQTVLSLKGNISGNLSAPQGFGYIGAPMGGISSQIVSTSSRAAIGAVNAGKGFSGSLLTGGTLGSLTAGWTSAPAGKAGTSALIQAENGIGKIIVLKDMTDTNIGVGLDGTAGDKPASIGMLYVGGNMLRSNVNAGCAWSDAMTYSDGASEPAWRRIEAAELGVVNIGGTLGDGAKQVWGIGSSAKIASIRAGGVSLLSAGENEKTSNNYRVRREIA
ncbi:MAG TPA: PKD domain-containing protein [Candidatus Brocadiia bacterium]|nr:PKD domain-containing protein [Candidatus Brocadiia bacterium]